MNMTYEHSFGFVYKWTDSSNGKSYIGSHKGFPEDNNYVGSGLLFLRAYNKRPKSFSREIIYSGFDFRQYEDYILNELDAANDDNFYNLKNSAIGGKLSDAHYRKQSELRKGVKRPKWVCDKITKSKWKYEIFCSTNNKTYSNTREASIDLNISETYVRSMINDNCNNYYGLKKIKK